MHGSQSKRSALCQTQLGLRDGKTFRTGLPHMERAAAAIMAHMCNSKVQTGILATYSGPCCHRKHHEGWKVAAGEVQNLLAYSHDLRLGLICAEALIFQVRICLGLARVDMLPGRCNNMQELSAPMQTGPSLCQAQVLL